MSAAEIAVRRAAVCRVIAALGDVLDSLDVIAESTRLPGDPLADTLVLQQHAEEAASAAETAAAHLAELVTALDGDTVALGSRLSTLSAQLSAARPEARAS